jgi:hypothetical protein
VVAVLVAAVVAAIVAAGAEVAAMVADEPVVAAGAVVAAAVAAAVVAPPEDAVVACAVAPPEDAVADAPGDDVVVGAPQAASSTARSITNAARRENRAMESSSTICYVDGRIILAYPAFADANQARTH